MQVNEEIKTQPMAFAEEVPVVQKPAEPKKRNAGPELLRIVCMMLIVFIHFMNQGGMWAGAVEGTFDYYLYAVLRVLYIPSTNCYVIISCWFMVNSKFKVKKLIALWIQVVFICITIYLIYLSCGWIQFDWESLITNVLPVFSVQYWFFTHYFIFMLAVPILSVLVKSLSKKQLILTTAALVLVSQIESITFLGDIVNFQAGYSFLWFFVLFFITATIKLHFEKPLQKINKYWYLLIFAVLGVILLFMNLFVTKVFYFNNAFNVCVMSFAAFLFFKEVNIKNRLCEKCILFVASLTFGVYLIHVNIYVFGTVFSGLFETQKYFGNPYSVLIMIVFSAILFVACAIIEYLRQLLFKVCIRLYKFIFRKNNQANI